MGERTTFLTEYVPMPDGEEMEIHVDYTKGGGNIWTGNTDARGIEICFWPVRREQRSVTRMLHEPRGRRIMVEPMGRLNRRRGEYWAGFVRTHLKAIAAAAIDQDWEEARRLLQP